MSNDQQLIDRFLSSRSEKAFKMLYRSHTPRLYAMALRLSNLPEEAEELIQSMWVKAIQKLPEFEGRSTLRTWLTGILINLNKERFRQESKSLYEKKTENNDASGTSLPEFQTIDLENAIKELPSGYRQILVLHDIEGYKHHEIAEMLGIADGTSKSQLFQARKAVREYLNDFPKTISQ